MTGQNDVPNKDKINVSEAGIGAGPEKLAEWVGVFLDLLEDRIAGEFGEQKEINAETLQDIMDSVRSIDDAEAESLYKDGWNEISSLVEEIFWMQERKFPLERLLVKHFALLLADRDQPPQQGHSLSRRVIPAFQYALQQMIGPEMLHEYEDRSRNLIQKIRDEASDDFEWDLVYNNAQASIISADVLIYVSRYFTDIPKRRQWMVDLFQRMMPAGKTDEEKEWRFGDLEFHMLVGSLFNDLFDLVESEAGLTWIKDRYGDMNLDTIKQMKRALDMDRLSVEAHSHQ